MKTNKIELKALVDSENDEMTINSKTATKSWTSKNPIEILPYNFSRSPLSESNFIIMIVLLKVKAMEMYKAGIISNPRNLAMKKPIKEVKTTCPIPVINDAFPTSFMTFGFKLRPTMNRRNAIPNWEKITSVSPDFIKFKKNGLTKIHVIR